MEGLRHRIRQLLAELASILRDVSRLERAQRERDRISADLAAAAKALRLIISGDLTEPEMEAAIGELNRQFEESADRRRPAIPIEARQP